MSHRPDIPDLRVTPRGWWIAPMVLSGALGWAGIIVFALGWAG